MKNRQRKRHGLTRMHFLHPAGCTVAAGCVAACFARRQPEEGWEKVYVGQRHDLRLLE